MEGDPNVANNSDGETTTVVTAAGAFHTVTPCRVLDTRDADGPYGGPSLVAGADRTYVMAGRCGIPSTAAAVSANLTVTQSTAAGNLRLYPSDVSMPLASNVKYVSGLTRANNAIVRLSPVGEVTVHCSQVSGTVPICC